MYDAKLLIVDDETSIIGMVMTILNREGFQHVDSASSGKKALEHINERDYNLIILDIMLPDMTGYELCSMIRQTTDAPIFFLTAKSSDYDKLSGFAYGGDDYITKPFNPLELVARMKAQLYRSYTREGKIKTKSIYKFGSITVDEIAAELRIDNKPVSCSAQLFHLLIFFCKHPNQVFTKEALYEKVWGDDALTDDHTVVVHIRRLRERIESDPSHPKYIKTVRGLGYKFVTSDQS